MQHSQPVHQLQPDGSKTSDGTLDMNVFLVKSESVDSGLTMDCIGLAPYLSPKNMGLRKLPLKSSKMIKAIAMPNGLIITEGRFKD